jgi:hypothetical protein
VVAFRALHAQRRSRLRGRRPVPAEPGATAPEPVRVTRAVVIAAEPFPDAGAAAAWLRDCGSRDAAADEVDRALELVNHAVSAHRVAAQDPHVRDLVATDVQRVRLGYGTGDDVVEGSWREAVVIPLERAKRRTRGRMLSPQEEMAGMLSGRRAPAHPSEELMLRARLDVDHGRFVEAALVLRAAADAIAAELAAEGHNQTEDTRRHREQAAGLAQTALAGGLSPEQGDELTQLLLTLERVVRRRRYADES